MRGEGHYRKLVSKTVGMVTRGCRRGGYLQLSGAGVIPLVAAGRRMAVRERFQRGERRWG